MNWVGCIPKFLKAHAGWLLTALGSAGLVGTAVLTAKAAPAARMAVEAEGTAYHDAWMEENVYPEEDLEPEEFDRQIAENLENAGEWPGLTFLQKMDISLPFYIPAILMGIGTLACFWGAQIFNVHKQAALVGAYGMLATQFDQYREAIRAEHGDEADKRAYEISRMKVKELQKEIERLKEENGPNLYEFSMLPGIIFEETPAQMYNALMHFNRNMMMRGSNTLAELFDFSGIPRSCFDLEKMNKYGWQDYENQVNFDCGWVDFIFTTVRNKYGRKVTVIDTFIPPYEVDVDYGFEGDIAAREYKEYDHDMAVAFAEEIGGDEVVKVDPDFVVYAPGLF